MLNWIFNKYTVPATYGAKIINSEKMEKIPVLIFSHGLGGTKQCYSTVCCELSSQGFIVGAVEHRDGSASFSYSVESFLRYILALLPPILPTHVHICLYMNVCIHTNTIYFFQILIIKIIMLNIRKKIIVWGKRKKRSLIFLYWFIFGTNIQHFFKYMKSLRK